MTRHNGKRILSALCTLLPCSVFAKSGGVNYSWGADALASMHDYVVTMMLYVQYIIYAVAGGFAVIAAFQIYIKMNTGEDGITKHILTLVGACLFIIGATIVFPAFFRLSNLENHECKTINKVQLKQDKYV